MKELDERQEALHRVNTLESRPQIIAPSSRSNRLRRRTRWQRFVFFLKALVLRPSSHRDPPR